MFTVVVAPEALSWDSKSGMATGLIFVRCAGADFPDPTWDDFVVDMLVSWASEVSAALSRSRSLHDVRLPFFDGPYELHVSQRGRAVSVETVTRELSGEVRADAGRGSPQTLIDALLAAMDAIAAHAAAVDDPFALRDHHRLVAALAALGAARP